MKCPPGASETFLIWDKMVYNNERHQNKESCTVAKQEFTHVGTLQLMKVRSLCTLNSWQDPLKARALVYQFAFNITKMRRHALQRSGVFYLASKLPPSQPTTLFFPLQAPPRPPSRFHFKCEVKVYVNICRASPPWRGNKSLDSCLNVWFFILSPAFLSLAFERNIPQGLCTHWISLFWQSKVERNVCNELSSCPPLSLLLLLPFLLSLYFLRGLDRDSSLPIWCRLDGQG